MNKLLLAALFASVATGAFASDLLPTKKGQPPAPQVYAPPFSWTGFYIGVNGGWGWSDLSSTNFANGNGGMFGGQAGYNLQMGQFVGGIEADLDGTDISSRNAYTLGTNKFSTGLLTTERVRGGLAIDRALLFVTAGYAGIDTRASFNDTFNGLSGYESTWRNGGAFGGGVEYAITNNISLKAEYLYMPFASQTYFSGTPDSEKSDLSINSVRGGINYKF
jgi:outer membrane immunogenic protein